MTWFKVDDQLAFHPKVIEAGNSAMGLWVRAGAWCSAHLTGGALPKHMIGTLGAQARDAKRLVEAGLWEQTDVGFQFRDWEDYQPSKSQVEADKAANRERQRRFRERRRNAEPDVVSNDGSNGVTNDVTNDAPTRPDPTIKKKERVEYDAEFLDWYKLYPRKADKGHASKAYRAARKIASAETLASAAVAFARKMSDTDQKFIPYPGKWLNGQQWLDEGIAPADRGSVKQWLVDRYHEADTRAVEQRSGMTYRQPDPPDGVDIRIFLKEARQQWIKDNNDEIIRRIMAREENAA